MLGEWLSHDEYRDFVVKKMAVLSSVNPWIIFEYEAIISKLHILNLDPLKTILEPYYSCTGRPSKHQAEIFRSFIIMNHLQISLDQWISKVEHNYLLRVIAGFDDQLPGVASYYDFINRLMKFDDKARVKNKKRKPSKKLKQGQKLPHKKSGTVQKLVNQILKGRRLNIRPEKLLQEIFATVCVKPSLDLGLIDNEIIISGDGTCIRTNASHFGKKTCECESFTCDCPRKFSDPNATWGWDSHNKQWFYGYTGYFISTYNKNLKLDLPIYLRLVDAKRHDSISAVVAIAEFIHLYPNLSVKTFLSDSASDNYPTYELLEHFNINAVIALNSKNKGKRKYPEYLTLNDQGVPICPAKHEMINWGFCGKDRCRIKWRCPKALGKVQPSVACNRCSPSPYGRVIYTKPEWDLRLYPRITRGTLAWKNAMKQRTAAERVNNRILHNYGVEQCRHRGKKKLSFITMIAGFNVHLDAQVKHLTANNLFDFKSICCLKSVA